MMARIAELEAQLAAARDGERDSIERFVREGCGMEGIRMMLAAGLPGGTTTQRVKNKAYAEGAVNATKAIAAAIARNEHRT